MRRSVSFFTCLLISILVLLFAVSPRQVHGVVSDAFSGGLVSGAVIATADRIVYSDPAGRYYLGWVHSRPMLSVYADGYVATETEVPRVRVPGQEMPVHIILVPNLVSGTVRDAETEQPLPGAQVSAGEVSVVADENGHYTLRKVTMGAPVSASVPGYGTGRVVFNGHQEQDFPLLPSEVRIEVVDLYSGLPLPDAIVQSASARSPVDAGGTAVMKRLPQGAVLSVGAHGYDPREFIYDGSPSMTAALRPNTLQGIIRSAGNADAIAGARVTAVHEGEAISSYITSADGRYSFESLPTPISLLAGAVGYDAIQVSVPAVTELDLYLEPFEVKGIYIPFGLLTNEERIRELIRLVDRTELNAIVVDMKSDRGWLAYSSTLVEAQRTQLHRPDVMEVETFLSLCKEKGIYTIARLVVFKDPALAMTYPQWAVRTEDDELWTDREGSAWGDPFRAEVQDYNVAIAKEVANLGFDELQFDYLRFPSDGQIDKLNYSQESSLESRSQTVRGFCARLRSELEPYAVLMSADVFGLTIWVSPEEDMGIGQRVIDIAPYMDYMSPMLYPATFVSGNLGYEEPLLRPYEVVYRSCIELAKRIETEIPASFARAKVRPWLQHYSWSGVTYGVEEMSLQTKAVADSKAHGWMFWNAAGRYNEEAFDSAPAPTVSLASLP